MGGSRGSSSGPGSSLPGGCVQRGWVFDFWWHLWLVTKPFSQDLGQAEGFSWVMAWRLLRGCGSWEEILGSRVASPASYQGQCHRGALSWNPTPAPEARTLLACQQGLWGCSGSLAYPCEASAHCPSEASATAWPAGPVWPPLRPFPTWSPSFWSWGQLLRGDPHAMHPGCPTRPHHTREGPGRRRSPDLALHGPRGRGQLRGRCVLGQPPPCPFPLNKPRVCPCEARLDLTVSWLASRPLVDSFISRSKAHRCPARGSAPAGARIRSWRWERGSHQRREAPPGSCSIC